MIRIVTAAVVAFALGFAPAVPAAPQCTTGKPCGDTCIAKDKKCHIPKAKVCKTGKACGDSCIAKDKTCTK